MNKFPDKPWLVVGTGPSFHIPEGDWNILTLNRAANHIQPDVLCFAHRICLNAISWEAFRNAKMVLVSTPFLTDPGECETKAYGPLKRKAGDTPISIHPRQDYIPAKLEDLRRAFPQRYTVATFAISWLRWVVGVDKFFSVGIDGGLGRHEDFAGDYRPDEQRLFHWDMNDYTEAYIAISEVAKAIGLDWVRLEP